MRLVRDLGGSVRAVRRVIRGVRVVLGERRGKGNKAVGNEYLESCASNGDVPRRVAGAAGVLDAGVFYSAANCGFRLLLRRTDG
jgi:hypothetical protein